jgi:hypothetical protein
MHTINNNDNTNFPDELMQQVHFAREILLKSPEGSLKKISDNENNFDKIIIYFPPNLEAHIIALIKEGLS